MSFICRLFATVPSVMLSVLALCCTVLSAQTVASSPLRGDMKQALLRQPLHFEVTRDGMMSTHEMGRKLRIENGGAVIFGEGSKDSISLLLDGANPQAQPTGQDKLAGRSNYILGSDPTKWRTGVNQFGKVQVPAVYPGIDLIYYGNGDQLEHDYLLSADADPELIRMKFRGASARLDRKTGGLILRPAENSEELMRLEQPLAYQLSENGTRQSVLASYRLRADGEVQFTLGNYDRARPLIIDPVITYSTYFGGSGQDEINDIKTDAAGNIYLLVETNSTDLPAAKQIAGACASGCGPGNKSTTTNSQYDLDFYVAKLDPTGTTLLFSTYIGGSDDETAGSFALDGDGSIYIAAETISTDFPLVHQYSSANAVDATGAITLSTTLTKLSADGSKILYSTLIGGGLTLSGGGCCSTGRSSQKPGSVAVGANGIAYLIGYANTPNEGYGYGNFVDQKGGTFTAGNGTYLAKFDTTKSGGDSLLFAMPYGTTGAQMGISFTSIALDSKGNVWATGQGGRNPYPATSDAFQPVCDTGDPNNCSNIAVMEFAPNGPITYFTYFGGTIAVNGGLSADTPNNIVLDASDNIYVSGSTGSVDFPVKNAAYSTLPGSGSGFLIKLAAGGKSLLYSTFDYTINPVVAVTPTGIAGVSGTQTTAAPVVNGTTNNVGIGNDAYYEVFDTTKAGAASLLTASYLGAPGGYTFSFATTFDAAGDLLFGGYTYSSNLPLVKPYQSACSATCAFNGVSHPDGFVTRVQLDAGTGSVTLVPTTQTFASTAVGTASAVLTSTLTNTTSSAFDFTPSFTDANDFKETDTCNNTVAAGSSCVFSFTFSPQSAGSLASTLTLTGTSKPSTTLSVSLNGTGTGMPALTITPGVYSFRSAADGSAPQTETLVLRNTGNVANSALTFNFKETDQGTQTPSLTYTNNCTSLAAGATCNIMVTFTPHSNVAATGTLTVSGDAGVTPVGATITGTGTAAPAATLTTTSYDFGSVTDGTTTPGTTFTLANTGGTSLTVSSMTFTGTGASAFAIVPGSSTCGNAFAANASCIFSITFSPTATTPYTATVNLIDQAGTQTLTVTGTGIAVVSPTLTPSTLDFGNVTAGTTSATQYITVKNPGPSAFQLTGLGVTKEPTGQFTNSGGTCMDGASVAAGASCTYGLTYSATSAGAVSAILYVYTSATASPIQATLTATGIAAAADFTLTSPGGAALTVARGLYGTMPFQVASADPSSPFTSPVTLSASGLPAGVTATFSPATITPGTSGASTTMTIHAPAVNASVKPAKPASPFSPRERETDVGISAAVLLVGLFGARKKHGIRLVLCLCALGLMTSSLIGCGSGTSNAPSTTNIIVTASSGSVVHSTTILLTLN
jgi:hypothetical protein